MANGALAIEGFDYQAMVVLELALDHFVDHPQGSARPEGRDDLDLVAPTATRHFQIKKPRRRVTGELTNTPWSLGDAADALLPGAIRKLVGTNNQQDWILGDDVSEPLANLVEAGVDAPTQQPALLLQAAHLLALEEGDIHGKPRRSLGQLKPVVASGSFADEQAHWLQTFSDAATQLGVSAGAIASYTTAFGKACSALPNVLERVTVQARFGLEDELRTRVIARLATTYGIDEVVARDTLTRSLRGFINDISKAGHGFNRADLEIEIRIVWPNLVTIKEPPPPPVAHLERPALVEFVVHAASGPVTEVIGVSGTGKTTLAADLTRSKATTADIAMYAEVRPSTSLRDLLVGVGYILRRYGQPELFALATQGNLVDEEAISRAASLLAQLPRPATIVLDAVEGDVADSFARQLAILVRTIGIGSTRLIAFAKRDILRQLPLLERTTLGVPHALALPGFSFDEFLQVAERFHLRDRSKLFHAFERLTAGRSGGLLPQVASLLARQTTEEIERLASLPPDQVAGAAEVAQFVTLPDDMRSAAKRVVCFVLPFRPDEAAALFPSEAMLGALTELERRGLLQRYEPERLEMHESIRTALVKTVAPDAVRATHLVLAEAYQRSGNITAAILHFDLAGEEDAGDRLARDAFSRGDSRGALLGRMASRRLLTGEQIVAWFIDRDFQHKYLLTEVLRVTGDPTIGRQLLDAVCSDLPRFDSDFNWAWHITEAILVCASDLLDELVALALGAAATRFPPITFSVRRLRIEVGDRTADRFRTGRGEIKNALALLLMTTRRAELLEEALAYAATTDMSSAERLNDWPIPLDRDADVERFLAAIPEIPIAAIVSSRSPSLGRLAGFVWKHRTRFKVRSLAIVRNAEAHPPRVVSAAMRALMFLGIDELVSAATAVRQGSPLRALASFLPGYFGRHDLVPGYEAVLLDVNASKDDRIEALYALAALAPDLSGLFERVLDASEPAAKAGWRFLFLVVGASHPFRGMAAALEQEFSRRGSEILGSLLMRLALFPGDEVTRMLLQALQHPSPELRAIAGYALADRRIDEALTPLLQAATSEANSDSLQAIATAALASRPTELAPFDEVASRLPNGWWSVVLAGRLRLDLAIPVLISHSTNDDALWKLRRAAIHSLARIGDPGAIRTVASHIIGLDAGFADNAQSAGHTILAGLLEAIPGELSGWARLSRQAFIERLAPFYEDARRPLIYAKTVPPAASALGWLWDRFNAEATREATEALERVAGSVHTPTLQAAVLRALRITRCVNDLEAAIESASSSWLAVRALVERKRIRPLDEAVRARLVDRINTRPAEERGMLLRVLGDEPGQALVPISPPESATRAATRPVSTTDARMALTTGARFEYPAVLTIAEADYDELIVELSPVNDTRLVLVPSSASSVAFESDHFSLRQQIAKQIDNNADARRQLRAMIVATAPDGVSIPWHSGLLDDEKHVGELIAAIAAAGPDALARVMRRDSGFLLGLTDPHRADPLFPLADERLIPHLQRFVHSGARSFFEVLCAFAAQLDVPDADSLFVELVSRWSVLVGPRPTPPDGSELPHEWRGLKRLFKNPRVLRRREVIVALLNAFALPIAAHHRDDLVRVLKDTPAAYSRLETRLLHTFVLDHFNRDEIDVLDDACDRLFRAPSTPFDN